MVEDTEWLFAVDREGDSGEGGEEAVGVGVLGDHVHETRTRSGKFNADGLES